MSWVLEKSWPFKIVVEHGELENILLKLLKA